MQSVITILLTITIFNSSTIYAHSQSLIPVKTNKPAVDGPGEKMALTSLIKLRCKRYMGPSRSQCKSVINKLMKVMDFKITTIPNEEEGKWKMKGFFFIAFKEKLIKLLNLPTITLYLDTLDGFISNLSFGGDSDFNLWDFTLKFFKNDKVKANMVLAVLFQDTTYAQSHIEYIYKFKIDGNKYFRKSLETLPLILNNIAELQERDGFNYNKYFFPKEIIDANINSSMYHFYVPRYLSYALQKQGLNSFQSSWGPFFLTLTYEMITISSDKKNIIFDPARLDPEKHQYKLKDIYSAYLATFKEENKFKLKSYDKFTNSFAVSLQEGVSSLFPQ